MPHNLRQGLIDRCVDRERVKRAFSVEIDRRFASKFSPFDFIDTLELGLSKLILWMLSENASHGQGRLFLDLFLKRLLLDRPEEQKNFAEGSILLHPEWITEHGRIDILLGCREKCIVIENKPYAGEGQDQLDRYFKAKDPSVALFLTNDGRTSKTAGVWMHRVVNWSYRRDFIAWLDDCRLASRSDRICAFLADFAAFCRREFAGMIEDDDAHGIASWVTCLNGEEIKEIDRIIRAKSAIGKKMFSLLRENIAKEGDKFGMEPFHECDMFKEKRHHRCDYYGYVVGDGIVAGLYVQDYQVNMGVAWKIAQKERHCETGKVWATAAKKATGVGEHDPEGMANHLWCVPCDRYPLVGLPRDWTSDARLWQKIVSPEKSLAESIREFAQLLARQLNVTDFNDP